MTALGAAPVRAAVLAGALALALPLVACRDAAAPPPHVLLILIDTLGAEHVSFLDPELDHTPQLARLARGGVVFRRAYSTAPWTQPAVASVLTGQMPSRHGVRVLGDPLPERHETLAEALARRGYQTAAVVSHDLIGSRYGFAQGFGHFDGGHVGGHDGITSRRVSAAAIRWLEGREPGRPFFLMVHYFDPHYAYQHHPEHSRTDGYAGALRPGERIWKLRSERERLSPADVQYLVDLHREEIAFTDGAVGELLDAVARAAPRRDTLVVTTSDHGEEFMRHGWIGHTRTLYEDLLRVPLVVSWPGVLASAVVETPVSIADIAPTIRELVGAAPPADPEGISLVPLLRGRAARERDVFAEVSYIPRRPDNERALQKSAIKTALVRGDLKLIHDIPSDGFELYDVARDRHERHDLFASHPAAAALRERLLAWERPRPAPGAPRAFGAAELRRLRELGYVE